MKKNILFALIAMLSLLLAACGTSEKNEGTNGDNNDGESTEKKVLEMATSADFAPFESRNKDGEFIGFDIDLANYIADELGYELNIQDMKFDGLIGALQNDRVDMVLAGMSATEKRQKNVDFSTTYNRSGEMFVTLKDAGIEKVEDLEGKTVGVQLGTIQQEGAEKIQEDIVDFEMKTVDSGQVLIQELKSNRIDVAYMDKAVAKGYIKEQDLFGFDDPTSSSPGMAVAFPKGSELVDEVNAILKEAEENGKLQELKDKWLEEEE
ncbi:ABC transporter substrate-binding protein [Aquibacillus sp. 3ASR75-11]|uniref:ABC transporter substrate-binding protein n=1 Tax=Terrihalobacillus insolitus TaxID=2950438 RepID=A0A9X3WR07_9BACI|nr:ABC transporter substrate-binding protein [Terrihalobacillus insolitus]MDC3414697.1 ABC transporter substrate-binding protein [Terrihalobacillus insolitus]MDC3424190.1 ABC transporter substrate-binding protein [Terrihalobacillus insolitus]